MTGAVRCLVVAGFMAAAGLADGASAAAQEPVLNRVEELAAFGRAEDARAELLVWWEENRGEASRRALQRGYWLRGRLTVDPQEAELDFRRLTVEYPGGPYTDLALFRLAQSAFARGDGDRRDRFMATLTRDYPGSPVRDDAVAWFEAAGPTMGVMRVSDADPSAESVQPAERGSSYSAATAGRQEDAPPSAQPATRTPTPAREATPQGPVTDPAESGRYAVQLGAFSSSDRAQALLNRASDVGFEPRLVRVRGSQLLHVRVGRFDSSRAASVFLQNVTDRGFTAAVVRDALDEEAVGL